jgi:mono/diheme cytochrome c family protein
VACHTIGGGRLVGPDLKDVTERQDRAWLEAFIQNPQEKLNSDDPYAAKILEESFGVQMVPVPGMTTQMAASLLDLIERESTLEESEFSGPKKLREPTADDVAAGEMLFTGSETLLAGGPPCISCHLVSGMSGLGGGRLGPDLTQADMRLGGMVGLFNWLKSPPTEQMKATFKGKALVEDEIFALAAYLGDVAERREARVFSDMNTITFGSMGLIGAMMMMAVFGGLWWWRMRSVRAPMIRSSKAGRRQVKLQSGGQNG